MSYTLSDQSVDVGATIDTLATRWLNVWIDVGADSLSIRRPVPEGWEALQVFADVTPDLSQSTLTRMVFTADDGDGGRLVVVARTPTGCKKGCK